MTPAIKPAPAAPAWKRRLPALLAGLGLLASHASDLRSPDSRLELKFAIGNATEPLSKAHYQRTYPNLMTMEGIAGDETTPPNRNTLTHLFSRLLAGPADNTICYYDARVDKMASHAYQLAKAVGLFSPWQHLNWYDRPPSSPAKAGGAETGIGNEPELEFFDALPTLWDDTKVLHRSIGEYAVIARRHGDEWFIGAMNSGEARKFDVALKFLPRGKKYRAEIYADDPAMTTRTHVRIEEKTADADTVLKCELSAQGGQAIRLTPQP